jgi:hypothetical protein
LLLLLIFGVEWWFGLSWAVKVRCNSVHSAQLLYCWLSCTWCCCFISSWGYACTMYIYLKCKKPYWYQTTSCCCFLLLSYFSVDLYMQKFTRSTSTTISQISAVLIKLDVVSYCLVAWNKTHMHMHIMCQEEKLLSFTSMQHLWYFSKICTSAVLLVGVSY